MIASHIKTIVHDVKTMANHVKMIADYVKMMARLVKMIVDHDNLMASLVKMMASLRLGTGGWWRGRGEYYQGTPS